MSHTRYLASLATALALTIATLGVSTTANAHGGGGGGHGGGGGFGGGGHGGFGGYGGGHGGFGGYGGFSHGYGGYGGYGGGHYAPGGYHGGGQWGGLGGYGGRYGYGHYGWGGYGHYGWDHYYGYYHHYPYFWGFGWPYWGFGWPYWGLGLGLGLSYPYYPYVYTYDVYPYDDYNGYVYQYAPSQPATAVAGNPAASVTAAYPPEKDQAALRSMDPEAVQFFDSARDAFTKGEYRDALRQASHAAIEAPQNPKVHQLMAQALLGLNDYRGAATEAHAALVLGPAIDWPTLFGYYGDAEKYTTQLRALEKYVGDNSTSAPARFLLGYQYLLTGNRDDAKKQLAEAVKLTPKDKLAEYLVKRLEAGQPIIPPPASPPPSPASSLPPAPAAGPSAAPSGPAPKSPPSAKPSSPKEL